MPLYLDDFEASLREAAAETWPETIPNGIWAYTQAEQVAWTEYTIPYAVIILPRGMRTGLWGVANRTFIVDAECWLVMEIPGDLNPLRRKLEDLRDRWLDIPLRSGQRIDHPEIDYSEELEVNRSFSMKNTPFRAGRVVAPFLVGEAPPYPNQELAAGSRHSTR